MQARTDARDLTRKGRFKLLLASAVTLAGFAFASSAFAGFSPISTTPGEGTIPGIMGHIYGGTFSLDDTYDYNNGSLTALRISDTAPQNGGLPYNDPGPNTTDQLWSASMFQATAEANFAELSTTPFGYIPGASGGTFKSLFSVTGTQYNVTGSGSFSPSGTFRTAAQNKYGMLSSLPSDNIDTADSSLDGKDHIVTYEIDGLPGSDKTWLLFFDDYGDNGKDGDFDYQDLVIQLKTLPPAPPSVPEPGSLMLLGGTMLALFKRARRSPG